MRKLLIALALCPCLAAADIQYIVGKVGQITMVGLSGDTKPASANGAVFVESDTAKVYLREGGAWVEKSNAAYQVASSELSNLVDNCVVGNDSTPIPDSCVGDGTDDGGAGGVDTANSPNANEVARFTDADTIEGRTAAEFKADLDLEVGTDLQALDADLTAIAALTTTAHGRGLLDDADAAASRSSLSLGTASTSATTDFGASNLDYLVGTAAGGLSAEIAVGTSPGGELGGTWAAPTLDDSVTVDAWALGASTATTASANDNDTSLATTAFVQAEIDDGDLVSDNCTLENDATPIPDSCVGDGSDAGGAATWTTLKQTSDDSKTNNTLASSSFLTVSLSAATRYSIRGVAYILVQDAGADARFDINFSGTWTTVYSIDKRNVAGVAAGTDNQTVRPASALPGSTDMTATSTGVCIVEFEITGLVNGAGTLSFRFAQVSNSATATLLKAGSYMEYATF